MSIAELSQGGLFIGDVASVRTVIAAILPKRAKQSVYALALHVTIGSAVSANLSNYWLIQVGTVADQGTFSPGFKELSLSGGLSAGILRRTAYDPPILLTQGNALVLRVTPRGAPVPLSGLSVAVEWGILPSVPTR